LGLDRAFFVAGGSEAAGLAIKTTLSASPGESTVPWPGMGDAELRVERGGGQ